MRKIFGVVFVFVCVIMSVTAYDAYADPWFGTGGGGAGGGGGGGGGGGNNGTCTANSTGVAGCGYSWIFYESTGNWKKDLYVRPLFDGATSPYISSTCAENSSKGGGFWHMGRNVIGNDISWWYTFKGYFIDVTYMPYMYRSDTTYPCSPNESSYDIRRHCGDDYAYQSSSGSFGHASSYTYSILSNYGIGYYGGTRNYNSKPGGKTSISDTLYAWNGSSWVAAYRAKKVSASDDIGSTVWNDYVEAYKAANNGVAPTSWPTDMYAFCYYQGIYSQPVTLTIVSVDTNRTVLKTTPDTVQVQKGERASKTISSISNYDKIKWCTDAALTQCTNSYGLTYTVTALNADTTVYAVFQLQSRTLTAASVNESGSSLSSVSADVTDTVPYNTQASVTRRTPTGYTFMGWKDTVTGAYTKSASVATYTINNLTANTTVYAVYVKNTFQGRARVDSGTSIGTSPSSTDYKSTDGSVTKNIDCANSGCNAIFDLYLKTTSGSGNTTFTVQRKKNSGNWTNVTTSPISPTAPATTGTVINKASGNYQESLTPGEDVCYRITFVPDGTATSTTATETACAHANVSTFEGKVDVGGGTTNWKNADYSFTQDVPCTAAGCSVTFSHNLKRTAGIGSTDYAITRTSNHPSVSGGAVASGTFSASEQQVKTDTVTLKPGVVVCETITFKPSNNTVTAANNVNVTACASALGNAQPDDPSNPPETMSDTTTSDAFIDMRVKNTTGETAYRSYRKTVYAKPTDILTYRATYNPVLQYAYYIDGLASKLSGWNNAFAIYSSGYGGANGFYNINKTYTVGDTTKQSWTNNYTVPVGAVGSELRETAETNKNNTVKTTPSQITFTNVNGTNTGTISTAVKSSYAIARIPYNFTLTIGEPAVTEEPIIYAGESNSAEYPVSVTPKTNTVTSSTAPYATIVRDAKMRIIVYVPTTSSVDGGVDNWSGDNICAHYGYAGTNNDCKYVADKQGETLNPAGALAGAQTSVRASIQEDRPAGTRICVAAAVYPASSGADTNLNASGSNTWRISRSTCYTVAKKPTFQIWGGSLYSIGNVASLATVKMIEDQNIAFSSWAERDVTAMGLVSGLASGAATGLTGNHTGQAGDGNAAGGGSAEVIKNFCLYRTPLSFANSGGSALPTICANFEATGLSGIVVNAIDLEKLIGDLPVNMGGADSYDNLSINSALSIANGQTYVIRTNGNVAINADIRYASGAYGALETLPKTIIYANNINISCSVKQIDAILIADRTINTCNTTGDADTSERSNQLVINGAIIANKLILGRTFGAYVGAYTKIPAEIINYDASIVLWARGKSSGRNYDNLKMVYQHEMAPRY